MIERGLHAEVDHSYAGVVAIIDQGVAGKGSLRKLLGSDAHAYAAAKVDALRATLDATAQTAPATDHPAA